MHDYSILCLDDDPITLAILEATLKMYNVFCAKTITEAYNIIEEQDIQIIIADNQLDETRTGLDFFKTLTLKETGKTIPLSIHILITGYAEDDVLLNSIDNGILHYYLEKPWDKQILLMIIRKAIQEYELKSQNKVLGLYQQQNKKILQSIHYAKRIQNALLPSVDRLHEIFPSSFLIYRPKDIIGGDFYWCDEVESSWNFNDSQAKKVLVLGDCTGHGVPGALLTIMCINIINETINKFQLLNPKEIIIELNHKLENALSKNEGVADGLDVTVIVYDEGEKELSISSLHQDVLIVKDGVGKRIKGDRINISAKKTKQTDIYKTTLHKEKIKEGDQVYIYSDGMPDQFGGSENRKLLSKNLRNKIMEHQGLPLNEQEKQIYQYFRKWKGKFKQTDDVTMIGLKF